MCFWLVLSALVALVSPVTPSPQVSSVSRPGAAPLTIDQAVSVATWRYPDATLSFVVPPADPTGAWVVALRQEGEVRRSAGNTRLWLDQYSGDVLAVRDPRRFTAGDTFLTWQFPLHNGEAFGLPGRLIVFASGLVPALLAMTGTIIWWTKRRGRRRLETRTEGLTPASRRR